MAALQLALGEEPPDLRDYRVGAMFVRIALDQLVSLEDFAAMTQAGELSRSPSQPSQPSPALRAADPGA